MKILWKDEHFHQIITPKLTSDMIENVHVDDYGNIWVGTLEGLNNIKDPLRLSSMD